MDYQIDPISAASPEMDDAEYVALKESIASIGQLVSIVSIGGRIIDGRKRYRACAELGKTPSVIELPVGADPTAHALALNLLRTQYSPSQRAIYAAVMANATQGDGPHIRDAGSSPNLVKIADRTVVTTAAAARTMGVATSSVVKAKNVRVKAIPEVVAAVERGDLTIHGATAIVNVTPKHRQSAALAAALTRPKQKDGRRDVASGLTEGAAPRLHRQDKDETASKALKVMAHAAEELDAVLDAITDFANADTWLAQLAAIGATVRRARTLLKEKVG